VYLQQGVVELANLEGPTTPSSLSAELAISRPPISLAHTTLPAVTEHRQNAMASVSNSSSRCTGIHPGSDIQDNDHTNLEDLWGEISCLATFNSLMMVAMPSNDFEPKPEIHPSAARESLESKYVLNN
jgi:hypothetical protein